MIFKKKNKTFLPIFYSGESSIRESGKLRFLGRQNKSWLALPALGCFAFNIPI